MKHSTKESRQLRKRRRARHIDPLASIWAELLQVERVGRHDDFFELGGHSIMAVTLIERMRRQGLKGNVRALFGTPTLAGLAAATIGGGDIDEVPPNLIPMGCERITRGWRDRQRLEYRDRGA